jgi:GxxExxY protein
MGKLIMEEETYQILGACFEVYKEKGPGFLEAVYQECLALEFGLRGLPFLSQPALALEYKGKLLQQTYRPDFLCFDQIIVELKAVTMVNDEHRAQVHNYLKASGKKAGLLVNFGHYPLLEHERIVR